MPKKEKSSRAREKALVILSDLLKPGDKVYTQVKHVSRSGVRISAYVVRVTNREPWIQCISGLVADAIGCRYSGRDNSVVVGGMGMGFHLVYTLGSVLFPNGGPLTESSYARRVKAQQADPSATVETDGGYLLHEERLP